MFNPRERKNRLSSEELRFIESARHYGFTYHKFPLNPMNESLAVEVSRIRGELISAGGDEMRVKELHDYGFEKGRLLHMLYQRAADYQEAAEAFEQHRSTENTRG